MTRLAVLIVAAFAWIAACAAPRAQAQYVTYYAPTVAAAPVYTTYYAPATTVAAAAPESRSFGNRW